MVGAVTDGPRLNAVEHGGDGPAALLVHGALGSRSYWNDNLGALSQVCRPVVVELWGHGRSPSPEGDWHYTPAGYVEQFELLRQRLGVDRWWLVGQSMGAALVLHYALAYPEVVRGVVITNSASAFTDPATWAERTRTVVAKRAAEVTAGGVGVLTDSWVNPGRSLRISDEVRAALAVEFAEHTTSGVVGSFVTTNALLPLGDRLEQLSVPVLLTNGVEEERFQRLLPAVRRIPGVEIIDLPASHAVNAHDPGRWNRAVTRFMRRH